MNAARKPVIVRCWTKEWSSGYAAADLSAFPAEGSGVELLDSGGKLRQYPWESVKWVCFVRELPRDASHFERPERLVRRRFSIRPRVAGVWLRVTLQDGEELEGVCANDRSLVHGAGLMLIPPDTRSNTQRVFVPRGSIRDFSVLGVVSASSPSRIRAAAQPQLFECEPSQEGLPQKEQAENSPSGSRRN